MPLNGSVSPDGALVRLAVITAVPVVVFGAVSLLTRWLSGPHALRRRHAGPAVPTRRPLELVAADVRRLARELAMVPSGTPVARRRGLLAAYDDVLCEAAAALEVPEHLADVPLAGREVERIRLLAALRSAGLVTD
ncbi:hypothetical protein SAMN05661080_00973 [Modestobacter sp. DSM 44400]|uniref:hypothetical protein n=1 Tax=Modestobacter sp. DSM 44400 TaxID=1550230 RepID=UPI00089AC77E|nr:hypothetical protein [Modestobacter sp. DSM 44400]SDX72401.1 hypothetical protein SAMN05661080_00973 [Modestobacter sp. DSM 44400]